MNGTDESFKGRVQCDDVGVLNVHWRHRPRVFDCYTLQKDTDGLLIGRRNDDSAV